MQQVDLLSMTQLQQLVQDWEALSDITIAELLGMVTMLTEKQNREALEADLIGKGMRLRQFPCEESTWADLKVIIRHLNVHASLYAAVHPDRAGWDMQNMLLADIADSLRWNNWAQTKDGKKGRNRPKPIPRPGIAEPARDGSKPKPSTLSAIKETFAARYGTRRTPKSSRLKDIWR